MQMPCAREIVAIPTTASIVHASRPHCKHALLVRTQASQDLLQRASECATLCPELRAAAKLLLTNENSVSWSTLHKICVHLRSNTGCGSRGHTGPWLHNLVARGLDLPKAPTRTRSPELEERVARLRLVQQEREYAALTADVSARETAAQNVESFSTFKDQIGFGAHVAAAMLTLMLLGGCAARAVSASPVAELAGVLLGAVVGMLAEVLLFIIRTTRATPEMKPPS
mmetsp:Transcript_29531/g.56760  ORF Transcript_29531/g.56760 Transcript_29531/m.56760 type:complete len:227 (-) Transcript_29531:163-843(-)